MYYKEFLRLKEFMKGVTDEYNWHVESIFLYFFFFFVVRGNLLYSHKMRSGLR